MIASGTLTEEDRHVIQDSVKRERESASSRPSVESACVSESVVLPAESVVLSVESACVSESVVLSVESVTPPIESITPAESVTLPTEHETPLVESVTPLETPLPNENPTLLSSTERYLPSENETPPPAHIELSLDTTSPNSRCETPSIPSLIETIEPSGEEMNDHLAENQAFSQFLEVEERNMIEELERLKLEDEERLRREREEREKRINQIRRENGLLSSDEENAWEQEEEEDCRRRTIFVDSLRKELSKMLTVMKTDKQVKDLQRMKNEFREKMREDEAKRKEAQLARERIQCEKRNRVMRTLSYAEKKERERKEQLRKERKAYAEQIKREAEEKERRERETRRRNEEERKKRLQEMNRQKEEEKRRFAEKNRQWSEEKKRLEEEERRKNEMALQKRRQEYNRIHKSGPSSPHSPPRNRVHSS